MFKDKVFAVTGGGNGIGREVVLELLRRGSKVAALDISETGLFETQNLAQEKLALKLYIVDITNREKIEEVHHKIIEDFGQVDGLIHVAGIVQPFVRVVDLAYKDIERVMNINFYGTLYLNKIFIPSLLKAPRGYLVNVSSMGGFLPVPGQAVYGASKSAVKLLTEALYTELKGTNVEVRIVFPGAIKTNIVSNSGATNRVTNEQEAGKAKMLAVDEAARQILRGMEKKKLYVYVGSDSKLMNKLYRLAPQKATNLIAKKMATILPN